MEGDRRLRVRAQGLQGAGCAAGRVGRARGPACPRTRLRREPLSPRPLRSPCRRRGAAAAAAGPSSPPMPAPATAAPASTAPPSLPAPHRPHRSHTPPARAGMYGGLRAKGTKADLALVVADVPAVAAGVFTLNVMCAAPVTYCKEVLGRRDSVRAVLVNAGQANAATGEAGYQDSLASADAVAAALGLERDDVLLESTGVIGRRIKMEPLLAAVPRLAGALGAGAEDAHRAAVAITTTDLVSKASCCPAAAAWLLLLLLPGCCRRRRRRRRRRRCCCCCCCCCWGERTGMVGRLGAACACERRRTAHRQLLSTRLPRRAPARPCRSLQSKSEEAAAGLQSELELATTEMERSQQRLATMEQEKAALLQRLAAQQQGAGAGSEAAGGGGAAAAGGGGSRAAEESLRQELHAQVGADGLRALLNGVSFHHLPCSAAGAPCSPQPRHGPLDSWPVAFCPPQRELATRLQSEVSALRQQLESGERLCHQLLSPLPCLAAPHATALPRSQPSSVARVPPTHLGRPPPGTSCRGRHVERALRGPAPQPGGQGGACVCPGGGAGQPAHSARHGGAAAAGAAWARVDRCSCCRCCCCCCRRRSLPTAGCCRRCC